MIEDVEHPVVERQVGRQLSASLHVIYHGRPSQVARS
jgi:hypothetical protein